MNKKIIIPLPHYGFGPTEAAIPWKLLSENNIAVAFTTPDGMQGKADERMLTGKGLGIWKPILQACNILFTACKAIERDLHRLSFQHGLNENILARFHYYT
jgi:protease I